MNALQAPTDNLYKFIAIFGLVLISLGVYTLLQRLDALGRGEVLVDIAYQPMFEQLKSVDDAAQARAACSITEAGKRESGQPADFHKCDDSPETAKAVAAANAQLAKLKTKTTTLELQRNYLLQNYWMYYLGATLLMCLGGAFSGAGFWLWYDKVQKYEDAALRAKAMESAAAVADDSN